MITRIAENPSGASSYLMPLVPLENKIIFDDGKLDDRSTGFGTSSNHSGPSRTFEALLFLRYLLPAIIRAKKICTYICAVKWNIYIYIYI
jgi:hypothetical protein